MAKLMASLLLIAIFSSQAWAQSGRITMHGNGIALRDVAEAAAVAMDKQLVYDPELQLSVTVDADNERAQRVLTRMSKARHAEFDHFVLGNALIVGRVEYVARYRDVVTSVLAVQPGNENAVANQIRALYTTADVSADVERNQVYVKVPRFMYQGMKVAVARIDASLPTAATAP